MPNSKRRRAKPLRLRDGVDETWTYDIEEKLNDPRFIADPSIIDRLEGKDVSVLFAQKTGFKKPILVERKDGLGIEVPPLSFNVRDASSYVGADRILDVMDVHTQTGERMPIKEFVKYFETPVEQRSRLLNVLSLEFSNTPLADMVSAPEFVRKIDWIDSVWPPQYKSQQSDGTNAMSKMMYPKVQKYFIMSVEKCYTDFHIDFGGTSVWYHVLKGEKVFWLIPPTDQNLMRFQEWTLSGQQNNVFFGDLVSEIYKIHLQEGNTFLIPSGWIHAVFTPKDTLVMGGNFLHSYSIPMQLYVFEIENNTQVPEMLRFPYYINIQWFAAERYVHLLSGKSFLAKKLRDFSSATSSDSVPMKPLTQYELDGLCVLLDWLSVNYSEKVITAPKEIPNPKALLDELKSVLRQHSIAEHESALTGESLLTPLGLPSISSINSMQHDSSSEGTSGSIPTKRELQIEDIVSEIANNVVASPAKRFKEECMDEPSTTKSSLDGLMETMTNCLKTVGASLLNNQPEVSVMTISESKVITPPSQPKPELLPEHKMQMDHSKTHKVLSGWCAKSSTVDTDTKSGDVPANRENAVATKVLKAEEAHSEKINTEKLVVVKNDPVQLLLFGSKPTQEYQEASPVPKTKTGNGNVTHAIITSETSVNRPVIVVPSSINAEWITKMIEAGAFRQGLPPDMSILEKFTAQNIQVSNGDQRDMEPTGQPSTVLEVEEAQAEPIKEEMNSHLKKEEKAWLAVFSRLTRRDLCTVMLVCKQFHDWALSSDFWETIKLTRAQLTSSHFTGLIKRQPMDLNLGWTYLPGKQLNFLLSRLHKLQRLSLPGNNWDTISTLKQLPHRSVIKFLDLRWAQLGYTEDDTKELLSSLRQVEELWLSGCEIRESGVRYIANQFSNLSTLDLSYCGELTDLAVELLCAAGTKSRSRLKRLSLAGCEKLSDKIFGSLKKLESLTSVDLSYCRGLSPQSIEEFAQSMTASDKLAGKAGRFQVVNNGIVKLING